MQQRGERRHKHLRREHSAPCSSNTPDLFMHLLIHSVLLQICCFLFNFERGVPLIKTEAGKDISGRLKKAVAAARQLCSPFVADPYLTLRELFTYFSRAQLNAYASQWCPL